LRQKSSKTVFFAIAGILTCTLLLIAFTSCRSTSPAQQQAQPSSTASPAASASGAAPAGQKSVLDVVLRILRTARQGGGVIMAGSCSGRAIQEEHVAALPAEGESMEQALGAITAQQQNIYWRESRETGVRVVDSKAQAGLLKLRVREFRVVEDLEPDAVMAVLWRQPEVVAFLRRRKAAFVRRNYGSRKVLSSPMVLEVKNRTVAEILDRIAAGYRNDPPKVWLYEECRSGGETLVDVRVP